MPAGMQERVRLRLEVVDADAGVGGDHAAEERAHVGVVAGVVLLQHRSEPAEVPLVRRLPRLLLAERRVGLGHLVEPAQDEVGLNRHRLLAPERAVVVEDRDALLGRNAVRRHALDEAERSRPSRRRRSRTASGSRHAQWPAASAASSFSTTWSIVKLAASCRGGNSLNVSRNWVTTAVAARAM